MFTAGIVVGLVCLALLLWAAHLYAMLPVGEDGLKYLRPTVLLAGIISLVIAAGLAGVFVGFALLAAIPFAVIAGIRSGRNARAAFFAEVIEPMLREPPEQSPTDHSEPTVLRPGPGSHITVHLPKE